jgi:aspartate-semialdehyde dehydrogenase
MKIAVIGATGLVGRKMLQLLEERGHVGHILILGASSRSVAKKILFSGKEYSVISVDEALAAKPDVALFSAGGETSRNYARKFAEQGAFVIDNSSAWRLFHDVPLVVPEINGETIDSEHRLIANPNCSTIQLVMALAPLHQKFRIKRLVISTYQSVTGSGQKGIDQLEAERNGQPAVKCYTHPIDLNLIPQGGTFNADGYTTEEQKLVDETRKILGDPEIKVTATVVRVPVYGGHSESVNIQFYNSFSLNDVYNLLKKMPGVTIQDDPQNAIYPMPLYSEGRDDVFVGRIRIDHTAPNALNLWIVSDNLRKGAATNAVQIFEYLINNNFFKII